MSGAGELAMFLAIGAAAVGLFLGPIGSALARRIAGRHQPIDVSPEIEEIDVRVAAEVGALQTRMAELEERVDFAERLLAQNREPDRLQR
jgi:hypothetical protein